MYINIHNYVSDLDEFYGNTYDIAKKGDKEKLVAFYGQPDQKVMDAFCEFGYRFIDLDIDLKSPDCEIVPEVYCHIIKDIINNAFHFREQIYLTLCTSGMDKCDQGRNVRDILAMEKFDLIDATNFLRDPFRPALISTANAPLKERVSRIMELCYNPLSEKEIYYYKQNQCKPRLNFHGVPPEDISLLDVFPDETHIQGWTKLVELGVPARIDMEWNMDNNAPTVFYTQNFCNKELMGQYLANKHKGLHVDGHGKISSSVMAKLEAFIKMRCRRKEYEIL